MIDVTTTHIATFALPDVDPEVRDERVWKAERAGSAYCYSCGKALKDGAGYTVCIVEGGDVALDPKDWDRPDIITDPGYMGLWDLGPECARNIPRYYKVKRS